MTNYPETVKDFFDYKYSESIIRNYIVEELEHLNRTDQDWFWFYISMYQTISEGFIRDFKDFVNWSCIIINQKLSEQFLIEFIEEVEIDWLKLNIKIPEEVKNRIINLKRMRTL